MDGLNARPDVDDQVHSSNTTGIMTDHSVILHEFSEHIKARPKVERFVYNYTAGDFDGLRTALNAIDFISLVEQANDTNISWQR